MSRKENLARQLLAFQGQVGPLPVEMTGVVDWMVRLRARLPELVVALECRDSQSASGFAARMDLLGVLVRHEAREVALRFPADAMALRHFLRLVDGPELELAEAVTVLAAALEQTQIVALEPSWALPRAVPPSRASAAGFRPEERWLTVLVQDVRVEDSGMLREVSGGQPVAVCVELGRVLTSLQTPAVGERLDDAKRRGVPTLPLRTLFGSPTVRLERARLVPGAEDPAGLKDAALAFLTEVGRAWNRPSGDVVELYWPCYLPARDQHAILDAVSFTDVTLTADEIASLARASLCAKE